MIWITVIAATVVFASPVLAETPRLVNYQGILTDADGQSLTGAHDLTFRIYPDSTQGAAVLWEEEHSDVQFEFGLFNVHLGSVTTMPDGLFATAERWLGIAVDTDEEISPRARITSAPYALRASVADSLAAGSSFADGDWTVAGNDMYSSVTGNVGVGTPDPAARLDVQGAVHVGGALVVGGN